MKQYDSYKDSGTPWIGQIPSHWEEKRMRFVCDYQKGKNPSNLSFDFETGMLPYLSMDYLRESTDNTQYTFPENDFVLCEDGDFLLLWDGSNAGEFLHSKKGVLCSTCAKLFPKGHSGKYFEYVCKSVQHYLQDMTNGMGIPHVDANVFKNLRTLVPPIAEQEAIASYLDKKCSSIDKIIATQEKRIALLGELKQSIITEAVTRGLNPDAPLKDSGIDWIGKIPEHWEAMKISHIYNFIGSGTTPSTDNRDFYDEDGQNWLQTGDLNDGYITETSKRVSDLAIRTLNMKVYPIGSLVVAMYGATVGKVGLLSICTSVNQACCVLPYSKLMFPKFAFYSFLSAKNYLISLSAGGGQPNISQDIIRSHHTPVPPLSEQEVIVHFLDKKCARIDKSITKAKREVELLREYKQTIITEAVTGKIKVC